MGYHIYSKFIFLAKADSHAEGLDSEPVLGTANPEDNDGDDIYLAYIRGQEKREVGP